jgi:hypothetical protein
MPLKKHDQNNLLEKFSSKPRYSQLTAEFNALAIILKLGLSKPRPTLELL